MPISRRVAMNCAVIGATAAFGLWYFASRNAPPQVARENDDEAEGDRVRPETEITRVSCNGYEIDVAKAGMELFIVRVRSSSRNLDATTTFEPPIWMGTLGPDRFGETHEGKGRFRRSVVLARPARSITATIEGQYEAAVGLAVVRSMSTKLRQWAFDATASTEDPTTTRSAKYATGSLSSLTKLGDSQVRLAWSPRRSDNAFTTDWIALSYQKPVRPTRLNIWKWSGTSFVTQVEAYEPAQDRWLPLWSGEDTAAKSPFVLSPPLTEAVFSTNRVRISVVSGTGNGICAVELVGETEPLSSIICTRGTCVLRGTTRLSGAGAARQDDSNRLQLPFDWKLYYSMADGRIVPDIPAVLKGGR